MEQEEKYREFKTHQDGGLEVQPAELMESGKIIQDTVRIPDLTASSGRFNTLNLQEELAKGMQQIMEADTKETLSDTMDNIKKIVDEIPYLKVPQEEGEGKAEEERYGHIETDEEIDDSMETDFQELLAEDWDGQISFAVPGGDWWEPQVNGQIRIEEVLAEWEKTKHAAEAAMAVAQQRKLESAKARALQEAEELMERLNQIIPKLNAGITPQELLAERYLQNAQLEGAYAGEFSPEDAGMEDMGGGMGAQADGMPGMPAGIDPATGMPLEGMAGMPEVPAGIDPATGMPLEGMVHSSAGNPQMEETGWGGYPANLMGAYPENPFLGNGRSGIQQFRGNNFGELAMQMSQTGRFEQDIYGMSAMDTIMPGSYRFQTGLGNRPRGTGAVPDRMGRIGNFPDRAANARSAPGRRTNPGSAPNRTARTGTAPGRRIHPGIAPNRAANARSAPGRRTNPGSVPNRTAGTGTAPVRAGMGDIPNGAANARARGIYGSIGAGSAGPACRDHAGNRRTGDFPDNRLYAGSRYTGDFPDNRLYAAARWHSYSPDNKAAAGSAPGGKPNARHVCPRARADAAAISPKNASGNSPHAGRIPAGDAPGNSPHAGRIPAGDAPGNSPHAGRIPAGDAPRDRMGTRDAPKDRANTGDVCTGNTPGSRFHTVPGWYRDTSGNSPYTGRGYGSRWGIKPGSAQNRRNAKCQSADAPVGRGGPGGQRGTGRAASPGAA